MTLKDENALGIHALCVSESLFCCCFIRKTM